MKSWSESWGEFGSGSSVALLLPSAACLESLQLCLQEADGKTGLVLVSLMWAGSVLLPEVSSLLQLQFLSWTALEIEFLFQVVHTHVLQSESASPVLPKGRF